MRETHSGAILRAHNPLPKTGTAGTSRRDCARSGRLITEIVAVSGRHVALDHVSLPGNEREWLDKEGEEGQTEVQGLVHPVSFLPLAVRLILVAKAHVIGDLLRLCRSDALPVGIGDALWLALDDERGE